MPTKRGIKHRSREYLIRHGVRSIVLWRDGPLAVVSIELGDGSWRRVVAADCAGMFYEPCDLAELDLVFSEGTSRQRDFDYQRRPRPRKESNEATIEI